MLTIRAATADGAAGIARVYMESAEYRARGSEPDRYWLPSLDEITAQYRERGRLSQTNGDAITLVAELDAQVVGFVDARLDRSPDPMHRNLTYCHIVEIAVAVQHQGQGIGERLSDGR